MSNLGRPLFLVFFESGIVVPKTPERIVIGFQILHGLLTNQ